MNPKSVLLFFFLVISAIVMLTFVHSLPTDDEQLVFLYIILAVVLLK